LIWKILGAANLSVDWKEKIRLFGREFVNKDEGMKVNYLRFNK
jgi:hypothetical protein